MVRWLAAGPFVPQRYRSGIAFAHSRVAFVLEGVGGVAFGCSGAGKHVKHTTNVDRTLTGPYGIAQLDRMGRWLAPEPFVPQRYRSGIAFAHSRVAFGLEGVGGVAFGCSGAGRARSL